MRTKFPYAFIIVPLLDRSTFSILKPLPDINHDSKYYILSSEGFTILTELPGEEGPHTNDILSLDCLNKISEELLQNSKLASEGKRYTQTRYHGALIQSVNFPYGIDYFRDYNPTFEEKFMDMVENVNSEYAPSIEKEPILNTCPEY